MASKHTAHFHHDSSAIVEFVKIPQAMHCGRGWGSGHPGFPLDSLRPCLLMYGTTSRRHRTNWRYPAAPLIIDAYESPTLLIDRVGDRII